MDIEKMYTNYLRSNAPQSPYNRQAQASDARKEMVRHDPDTDSNSRKGRGHKNSDDVHEDDFALVSISSLLAFLIAFLSDITEQNAQDDEKEGHDNT